MRPFAERPLVNGRLGELTEVLVRERRPRPAGEEALRAARLGRGVERMGKCPRHPCRRPLRRDVVFALVGRCVEGSSPDLALVVRHRMALDELLDEINGLLRERRRRGPAAAIVEPDDGVGAVTDERNRGARLERHRERAASAVLAHLLAEGWPHEVARAVASGRRQTGVRDFLDFEILRAAGHFLRRTIEPAVEDHPVVIGERSGPDRRVADARDSVQVRVRGVREPGAAFGEAVKPFGEQRAVPIQVVRPHLIHHEDDHQPWRSVRRRLLDVRGGGGEQDEAADERRMDPTTRARRDQVHHRLKIGR